MAIHPALIGAISGAAGEVPFTYSTTGSPTTRTHGIYTSLQWTGAGSLVVATGEMSMDLFIVSGGGGGGGSYYQHGGGPGGGAGGAKTFTGVTMGVGSHAVGVGAGGSGGPTGVITSITGSDSSMQHTGGSHSTSGGGGCDSAGNGDDGGSGGGGHGNGGAQKGDGIAGEGHDGGAGRQIYYYAGGGGGKGGVGQTPGTGQMAGGTYGTNDYADGNASGTTNGLHRFSQGGQSGDSNDGSTGGSGAGDGGGGGGGGKTNAGLAANSGCVIVRWVTPT